MIVHMFAAVTETKGLCSHVCCCYRNQRFI